MAILLPNSGPEICVVLLGDGWGPMRKIIMPLASAMAFIMPLDATYHLITQMDPHLKALFGGGLFFSVWVILLWDDLAAAEREGAVD